MCPPSFHLPQIERVRLDIKSAAASRRSSEQEVLHYQWFADLGNTDAARAVGQMLSSGSLRDPLQALRYFRQAPEICTLGPYSYPIRGWKPVEHPCLCW